MYIRFLTSVLWRDVSFMAGRTYGVGPRLRHKFVTLQGKAIEVRDPEDIEAMVPDPGEKAPSRPPPPDLPPVAEAPLLEEKEEFDGVDEAPRLSHRKGPWYDVVKGDVVINERPLRKSDAEILLNKLNEAIPTLDAISSATGN